MKRIILLLAFALTFWGCEKKFDNTIDSSPSAFQVRSVKQFSEYDFSLIDSSLALTLEFANTNGIKSVSFQMFSPDGKTVNAGDMYNNGLAENDDDSAGDNIYSSKVFMQQYYPNGKYTVNYYVTDINDNEKFVASQAFTYNNNQLNVAPVLSDLIMPDSIATGVNFQFTVKATDQNGAADIQYVYFEAYKPDGTQLLNNGQAPFVMPDNGDTEHYGDVTAGDGIFSYKNSFASTAQKGVWKFEFVCYDRGGLFSNKIIHYIKVL